MLKKLLLLLLLSVSINAEDVLSKEFWQNDKQKHFAMSATIAGSATALARHYGSNKFEAFWIGFGSSLAIGVLKEYYDSKNPLFHTEDTNDIYADMMGAITSSLISTKWTWRF